MRSLMRLLIGITLLAAADHNPGQGKQAGIRDKGCGGKRPNGNFGAAVETDVVVSSHASPRRAGGGP